MIVLSLNLRQTPLPPINEKQSDRSLQLKDPPLCRDCPEGFDHIEHNKRIMDSAVGSTVCDKGQDDLTDAPQIPANLPPEERDPETPDHQRLVEALEMAHRNDSLTDVSVLSPREYKHPSHVSLYRPLEKSLSFFPNRLRPLPKWMSKFQLPRSSNKNQKGSKATTLLSSKLPVLEAPQPPSSPGSGSSTSLIESPLEEPFDDKHPARRQGKPTVVDFLEELEEQRRSDSKRSRKHSKPRRQIVPLGWRYRAKQISGSPGETEVETLSASSMVFRSEEIEHHPGADKIEARPCIRSICQICEEPAENDVMADNPGLRFLVTTQWGARYHAECISCKYCRKPYKVRDLATDWIFWDSTTPYHKWCGSKGIKSILDRLHTRAIDHGGLRAQTQGWKRLKELERALQT